MELVVEKKEKNLLEFVLKGERHTYSSLLKEKLLEDSSVQFASYILPHPLDNEARFVVKTKGKDAKKAVLEAIKKIDGDLKNFESSVSKALK